LPKFLEFLSDLSAFLKKVDNETSLRKWIVVRIENATKRDTSMAPFVLL
jgi:hypothetical protein